jgi:hypothetical protein
MYRWHVDVAELNPIGLSVPKPSLRRFRPFDKLRANGVVSRRPDMTAVQPTTPFGLSVSKPSSSRIKPVHTLRAYGVTENTFLSSRASHFAARYPSQLP